jgi:hypothetical protein
MEPSLCMEGMLIQMNGGYDVLSIIQTGCSMTRDIISTDPHTDQNQLPYLLFF